MSLQSGLQRSFGGLGAAYYLRNVLFAALLFFAPLMLLVWSDSTQSKPGAGKAAVVITVMYVIATLLYPYSRFVYERLVGFVIGGNVFSVPTLIFLPVKLLTMLLCYGLSFFIAPVGLVYLYFRNANT